MILKLESFDFRTISTKIKKKKKKKKKKIQRVKRAKWTSTQKSEQKISEGMAMSAKEWWNQRRNGEIGDGMGKSAMEWWYLRRFGDIGDGFVRAYWRWFGEGSLTLVGFLCIAISWVSPCRRHLVYDILGAKGFFFFWWNWELKVEIK